MAMDVHLLARLSKDSPSVHKSDASLYAGMVSGWGCAYYAAPTYALKLSAECQRGVKVQVRFDLIVVWFLARD